MRRALTLALALCAGCYAEPPPPASSAELTGCRPGAFGTLSEHRCRADSDCVLCACERVESRAHLAVTNAACAPDPLCDAEARCCHGRCVRTLGPPRF